MRNLYLYLLCLGLSFTTSAQNTEIPQWFLDDLQANIGTWVTDNSAYVSENEPMTKYAIEWTWGIGKTSIEGKLYGYVNDERTEDFWHFRQYWDNVNSEAILMQFGSNGMTGIGPLKPLPNGEIELIQVYSVPDGTSWQSRHLNSFEGADLKTISFDWAQEKWVQHRFYIWKKES